MAYKFNMFGWYVGEVPDGTSRSTDLVPTNMSTSDTPVMLRCNWNGTSWVELPYVHIDENSYKANLEQLKQAENAERALEESRLENIRQAMLTDSLVSSLRGMTSAEVDAWCDSNITTIIDLKDLMKKVIKILIAMNKDQ